MQLSISTEVITHHFNTFQALEGDVFSRGGGGWGNLEILLNTPDKGKNFGEYGIMVRITYP